MQSVESQPIRACWPGEGRGGVNIKFRPWNANGFADGRHRYSTAAALYALTVITLFHLSFFSSFFPKSHASEFQLDRNALPRGHSDQGTLRIWLSEAQMSRPWSGTKGGLVGARDSSRFSRVVGPYGSNGD